MSDIDHASIVDWATDWAKANKPKFHAALMDAPYELNFMSKGWDNSGVAFKVDTWRAVYDVLMPGAFMFVFGGSRTVHRMAVAIEDSGFRLHPTICWIFGCLSEDTEILTQDGWKTYNQVLHGSMALCYNIDTDALDFMPVEKVYTYEIKDTCYRIQSDSTDQVVTKNHRCIVERSGRKVFRYAATLERQETIPILEVLPNLQDSILGEEQRPILQGFPLQPGMFKQNHFSKTQRESVADGAAQNDADKMRGMWQGSLESQRSFAKSIFANLFKLLQWKVENCRLNATFSQGACWLDRIFSEILCTKNVRGKQSRLEGWRYIQKAQRQLCGLFNQVCALSRRILINGPQGWLCYGASTPRGASDEQAVTAFGGGASCQPQPRGQQARKPDAIQQQQGPQEIRSDWKTRSTLATVTPIHYEGTVWCVKVPTGAFVARRNGKVFVTGNSGFPKATRIRDNGQDVPGWDGHRYGGQSMKPAAEFIVVAQKPYNQRPVDSITATGAGAINIEAGRIGTETITIRGNGNIWTQAGRDGLPHEHFSRSGRWPANVALTHAPACTPSHCSEGCAVAAVGRQSGELSGGSFTEKARARNKGWKNSSPGEGVNAIDNYGDTGTAARYFHNSDYALEAAERIAAADPMLYTPKADRWQREAGLSNLPIKSMEEVSGGGGYSQEYQTKYQARKSARRNSHPTVKPLALCHWLASLLLPPDAYAPRRLLVPFSGSGSEMIGALLAGWDHVQGVEIEREYIAIAEQRIAFWQQYAGMDYNTARQYAEAKQEQLEREARMNAPLDDLPLFAAIDEDR